jgi:hypothetical protein
MLVAGKVAMQGAWVRWAEALAACALRCALLLGLRRRWQRCCAAAAREAAAGGGAGG